MTPHFRPATLRATAMLGVVLLFSVSPAFAQTDGPYVLRNAAGAWEAWTVVATADGARKKIQPVDVGTTLTIPAVGALPAFEVRLRAAADVAAETIATRSRDPIFVVADTHGEYQLLGAMLQKHRVVDERLRWSFGRGQLVILGDVFDRGPNHTEILWLIYELEAQARRAGGGVHLALGNHETMVMAGDLRYLHPKYTRSAELLGVGSYAGLFGATSMLGQWLRMRPVLLKINDLLCLHAGISRALLDSRMSRTEINAAVRLELATAPAPASDPAREPAGLLMGSLGPLWYRGYFAAQTSFPAASQEDIDRTLEWSGVRRILVGHTIVPTITPLFDGKVIAVQVYPRRDEAGAANFESLLVRRGELWRATLQGLERLAQ